ncbi:50S ribosomal protein L32e [Candidatus Bathyarchaeota archaeon]|nr:50S ribosomal protein L32e [Candidatus Bathyarchaeota archaeon]
MPNQRRAKRKKPEFRRQDSYKYVRVKDSWRRPRGKSSRMRLGIKGWPVSVRVGFRSKKSLRGLHPSGLEEVLIYRPKDLDSIDPSRQAARIGHTVGAKKRTTIIEKAKEHNIRILNPQGVVLVESKEPEETSI